MSDGGNTRVVQNVAIVLFTTGVTLEVTVRFTILLAKLSPELEPNWTEITLAVSTVVLALATLGLAVAAVLALGSINESRHARNAETTMDISRRWAHADFRDVRWKVEQFAKAGPDSIAYPDGGGPLGLSESMQKLRIANDRAYRELRTEPDYYEDLAILLNHEAIEFSIVNECFGYGIPYRWSLWKPTVDAFRDRANERAIYIEFEKLAKRLAAENPKSVQVDRDGEIIWPGFID